MHCSLYCQDCIHFGKFFLRLAKLEGDQNQPRSLDALTSSPSSPALSLEDRNRALLRSSFFLAAFQNVRAQHERAGCIYLADADRIVRNLDLRIVGEVQTGIEQFFDPNSPQTQQNRTIWVASEGPCFYVVNFGAAQTAQRNYVSVIPVLQARPLVNSNEAAKSKATVLLSLLILLFTNASF